MKTNQARQKLHGWKNRLGPQPNNSDSRGILSAMEDLAQQNHQDPSWGQYKATVILILLCESEV